MESYQSLTIKTVLEKINRREILLPMIQREMVWEASDIEKLFDSIASGYPFGTMLFWEYTIEDRNAYRFYEFISSWNDHPDHASENHNKLFNPVETGQTIWAVLDGQQRLTALRIGLTGTMTVRRPGAWRVSRRDSENYEKKELYVDLTYEKSDDAEDVASKYCFKFKTAEEVAKEPKKFWLRVGRILDIQNIRKWWKELPEYDAERFGERKEDIGAVLQDIYDSICRYPLITYFPVRDKSMDTVLNIFIRINQGGEALSYTDFLMSILVNYWADGREVVNESLDTINSNYDFKIQKDVFLRACLFMTGASVDFRADNFDHDTVIKIADEFNEIRDALAASCRFFSEKVGYSKSNLRSTLIFLPLALYMKEHKIAELDHEDEERVRKWIQFSILSGAFGGQTNSYLAKLQTIVSGAERFPVDKILQVTKDDFHRNFDFSVESVEEMVTNAKKGSQDAFTLLTILYPGKNYTGESFDEDHIYPISKLTTTQQDKKVGGNYLSNLQLLPQSLNRNNKKAKNPEKWLQELYNGDAAAIAQYKRDNYLFDAESGEVLDLSPENFENVMEKRRANLVQAIVAALENA